MTPNPEPPQQGREALERIRVNAGMARLFNPDEQADEALANIIQIASQALLTPAATPARPAEQCAKISQKSVVLDREGLVAALTKALYDDNPAPVISRALSELTGLPLNAPIPWEKAIEVGFQPVGLDRHARAAVAFFEPHLAEAGELAELRAHVRSLINLAIDGDLTNDILAQLYPDSKKRNGQPASDFTKRARRVINEARAALDRRPG